MILYSFELSSILFFFKNKLCAVYHNHYRHCVKYHRVSLSCISLLYLSIILPLTRSGSRTRTLLYTYSPGRGRRRGGRRAARQHLVRGARAGAFERDARRGPHGAAHERGEGKRRRHQADEAPRAGERRWHGWSGRCARERAGAGAAIRNVRMLCPRLLSYVIRIWSRRAWAILVYI